MRLGQLNYSMRWRIKLFNKSNLNIMRIFTFIVFCMVSIILLQQETILAQPSPVGYQASFLSPVTYLKPEQINASDGTYTKYVLIRWMSPGSAKSFQLFKSKDNVVKNATLVNQQTLESSWLLDYDVQPGVKYHYWVKANYAAAPASPFSTPDEGFAAKLENIALEEATIEADNENLVINEPERFDTNPFLEPMVNDTRSTDFRIDLTTPEATQEFTPAHDLIIEFNGAIEDTELPEQRLLLHIYTNDKNHFIEDLTLVKTPLTLVKSTDTDTYTFSLQIPFPYPSGLYYYAIQLEEEEDPIQIGKLLIK